MKILLIGEYSNLHHTLCEALRRAGHDVLLVSDGDGWKDYPRDIDLRRQHPGPLGSLLYLSRLATLLPRMRGYDVVQIINPVFLDVKARWNRWVFDYLRRHNRLVSVGCFGDDYYVVNRMQDPQLFDYTDFQAYGRPIEHDNNRRRLANWNAADKAALTRHVMANAGCLVACLYEYWKVYDEPSFHSRLHYVPLPVQTLAVKPQDNPEAGSANNQQGDIAGHSVRPSTDKPVNILFAAQRTRAQMKGTDQLEPLFDRLAKAYPDRVRLHKIVSVPFAEYRRLVAEADVVVDQLYSYTPAMGALESLSQGKVVISGYETEYARFLNDVEASGIINLRPFADDDNYALLERLLTDAEAIERLRQAALSFVRRLHDADRVASLYIEAWSSAMGVGEVSSSSNRSSQR